VIGVFNLVVVLLVTDKAIRRQTHELSAAVAVRTVQPAVLSLQDKASMGENSTFPPGSAVTVLTPGGKPRSRVVGFAYSGVVLGMTIKTNNSSRFESILSMAVRAIQGPMRPCQRKTGDKFVVPLIGRDIFPGPGSVTLATAISQS
jgi:hypothetical protein